MKLNAANSLGRRERGASMLVALIFLVVLATLGTTLANVTTLEERMASNTRDRDLALQAAEAALADAQAELLTNSAMRTGAATYDASNANTPAYWETCFGGTAAPCTTKYTPDQELPTDGPGAVAEQPRYVVQRMNVGTPEIYRVTARGVGGTTDTIVVLQAEFDYKP
jgi:type IV pilus assembly protein PilX